MGDCSRPHVAAFDEHGLFDVLDNDLRLVISGGSTSAPTGGSTEGGPNIACVNGVCSKPPGDELNVVCSG